MEFGAEVAVLTLVASLIGNFLQYVIASKKSKSEENLNLMESVSHIVDAYEKTLANLQASIERLEKEREEDKKLIGELQSKIVEQDKEISKLRELILNKRKKK